MGPHTALMLVIVLRCVHAGGHDAAVTTVASLDLDKEVLPERRTRFMFLDILVRAPSTPPITQ
jgi:hypothetical protein